MSLLGFDSAGSATINGLTEINANNVFSDVLYYDAGTVPVNVKTAIDGITVDVTALEADVLTLQGEMNAVEADVATLQGEMNDVEADVATLQGEMNDVEADVATLQSDVTALTISTGITAATVAGLVISQAAQDVTIASHTVSIAALQLEDLSLDTRIDALEVKTTDQSWGSLTGTSFSTKVNVGGGSGVVLNTGSASEFNSGIVCSSIASTSATTNIDIGSALTTGDVNLGSSAGATGVALNWGGASNSGNLTFTGGSFTLTSTELLATAMTFTTNTNGSDLILNNATTGNFSIGAGTNQNLIIEATGTGTLSLVGAVNGVYINDTGVANTNIGNTTGVTTVTGQATFLGNTQFGDASADAIVPNGTLTKPFIIGTYASQSSYSTTSTTPITTYLGGTLESVKTFTNSATGNFRYIMASVSPFDANGGITLSGGTYMFWLAINFEDGSSFNLTDLTMGLSTVSTLTSASSEATIIASLPNLTCFFHKTDAGDAVASDSEQRVLSSCFNLASSTTVYPFYFANHSVTVDTVSCNTVFVKIGSA